MDKIVVEGGARLLGKIPVSGAKNAALPLLVKGGFYHAGQVCVSVQRVFADRRIARSLAGRIAESAEKLRVGDPTLNQLRLTVERP